VFSFYLASSVSFFEAFSVFLCLNVSHFILLVSVGGNVGFGAFSGSFYVFRSMVVSLFCVFSIDATVTFEFFFLRTSFLFLVSNSILDLVFFNGFRDFRFVFLFLNFFLQRQVSFSYCIFMFSIFIFLCNDIIDSDSKMHQMTV
jgi:hypothetical protein